MTHALELPATQLSPVNSHSACHTAIDRAARPDYRRWLDHVSSVRGL
ncbi:MAG: hypothetical protein LC749_07730 [Actinobacteria bacterium]|nr:hypothetical protein [Actinomycetota bacterium]